MASTQNVTARPACIPSRIVSRAVASTTLIAQMLPTSTCKAKHYTTSCELHKPPTPLPFPPLSPPPRICHAFLCQHSAFLTPQSSIAQVSHGHALSQEIKQTIEAAVQAAADWQAAGLQRQGSNTGVCLRTNFQLMADTVVKQDGHLLVEEEKQLLECFQVVCTASSHSLAVSVRMLANGNKHYTDVLGDMSPSFLLDFCNASCSLSTAQSLMQPQNFAASSPGILRPTLFNGRLDITNHSPVGCGLVAQLHLVLRCRIGPNFATTKEGSAF